MGDGRCSYREGAPIPGVTGIGGGTIVSGDGSVGFPLGFSTMMSMGGATSTQMSMGEGGFWLRGGLCEASSSAETRISGCPLSVDIWRV